MWRMPVRHRDRPRKGGPRGRAAAVGSDTMRAGQPDGANLSRRFMDMFNMCVIIGSLYNNLLGFKPSSPPCSSLHLSAQAPLENSAPCVPECSSKCVHS